MAGFLLDSVATTITCFHGAVVTPPPPLAGITLGGKAPLGASGTFAVASCPAPDPKLQCKSVSWTNTSTKVTVGGSAVLLSSSIGTCKNASGVAVGPAQISDKYQKNVLAT